MNTSTAYNHLTRLKSKLESLFSAAQCYMPTHDHLLGQVAEVWQDEALKKCPSWVIQALGDYAQSRWDRIQREYVFWLHPAEDGTFKSWDLLTDKEREEYIRLNKKGSFIWLKETTGRGTIGDQNKYQQGATITRTFEITGKIYS